MSGRVFYAALIVATIAYLIHMNRGERVDPVTCSHANLFPPANITTTFSDGRTVSHAKEWVARYDCVDGRLVEVTP